jgi:hypothetical protein
MLVSDGKTALKRFGADDNDPLLIWLNEGMHQLEDLHAWPFLQKIAIVGTVAGDATMLLPSALHKVHSIRDTTGKAKLEYKTISEFERVVDDPTATGAPEIYTITGTETIQLYPVVDSTRSFRVVYQEELTEMTTDGASMPGPTRIHYPIVQFAAVILLQAENEEDRAVAAKSEAEAAADRLWAKYSSVENDEPQQVTDVMSYGNC